jgi:hypothetical protein
MKGVLLSLLGVMFLVSCGQDQGWTSKATLLAQPVWHFQGPETDEARITKFYADQSALLNGDPLKARAKAKFVTAHPDLASAPVTIQARRVKQSSIFEIKCSSPEPQAASAFLDAFLAEYIAFQREAYSRGPDSQAVHAFAACDALEATYQEARGRFFDAKEREAAPEELASLGEVMDSAYAAWEKSMEAFAAASSAPRPPVPGDEFTIIDTACLVGRER